MADSEAPAVAAATLAERVKLVCEQAGVRLAVLFGSRATGRARAESDLDVGIWPGHGDMSLAEELALASRLSEVSNLEVDLVRLDRDDPLLGREVARTGRCLYERTAGAFAAYRARAVSVWLDFDETIAPHRARMLRRLAERIT